MTRESKVGRPSKGGIKSYSPIAEKIREITSGETQQEIADKIGISRQAVGCIIGGANKPDIDTLLKIVKAYNISADYLLGLSDTKSPKAEIRAICEYMGLTEEAVNTLARLSKHYENLSGFIEKGHLSSLLAELTLLSDKSTHFLEFMVNAPSAISNEYELTLIDSIRGRATLQTFQEILNDYDARKSRKEEFEKSKELGRKANEKYVEQHSKDLLDKIMKGEIEIGTNRKENEQKG